MKHVILPACLLLLASCQSIDSDIAVLAKPNFADTRPPAMNSPDIKTNSIRFATFNTSLYSEEVGGLIKRLNENDVGARKIAAVIQHQRPNILLLNEFDYDAQAIAVNIFQKNFLAISQDNQTSISYPYYYIAPVNTGVQSGMDLDNNGKVGGDGRDRGNDAFGYCVCRQNRTGTCRLKRPMARYIFWYHTQRRRCLTGRKIATAHAITMK